MPRRFEKFSQALRQSFFFLALCVVNSSKLKGILQDFIDM